MSVSAASQSAVLCRRRIQQAELRGSRTNKKGAAISGRALPTTRLDIRIRSGIQDDGEGFGFPIRSRPS